EKKIKIRLYVGKMLIDTGRGDDAIAEYNKVLAINPNDIEAILGVGLALSQSGDLKKYREAEYYLERFVEQAPDNHPLKTDIKNTLEFMKQENNDNPVR
ncbi:MAG TPA: tetratricopeptide repeat protein, partial [Pedobacter sp.]